MWLKISLLVCLWCYQVEGWGYRYNYNAGTGDSNLWTYLPGTEQPVVYQYVTIPQAGVPWPEIYSVPYDGLLPGQSVLDAKYSENASLYRYKGADGKYRYKCKPEAYWSEYLKKCVWKPGHFSKP